MQEIVEKWARSRASDPEARDRAWFHLTCLVPNSARVPVEIVKIKIRKLIKTIGESFGAG